MVSPVQLELTAQFVLKSTIAPLSFESHSARAMDPLVNTSKVARPGLIECEKMATFKVEFLQKNCIHCG